MIKDTYTPSNQQFFKPILESNTPTKKTKDQIIHLLMNAVKKYEKQCQTYAPNKAALARKYDILTLIKTLKASKTLLEQNNTLTQICEFYLKYRDSGRLLKHVRDVLVDIFDLQKSFNIIERYYERQLDSIPENRRFEIDQVIEACSDVKKCILKNNLRNQINYNHYIVATYANTQPHLGPNLTEIVASYIPKP